MAAKLLRAQSNSVIRPLPGSAGNTMHLLSTSGKPVEYKLKLLSPPVFFTPVCFLPSVPQSTLIRSNSKDYSLYSVLIFQQWWFFFSFPVSNVIFIIICYTFFLYLNVDLSCLSSLLLCCLPQSAETSLPHTKQFLCRQPSTFFSRCLFQTSCELFVYRTLTM